jgi:hypothetical protein
MNASKRPRASTTVAGDAHAVIPSSPPLNVPNDQVSCTATSCDAVVDGTNAAISNSSPLPISNDTTISIEQPPAVIDGDCATPEIAACEATTEFPTEQSTESLGQSACVEAQSTPNQPVVGDGRLDEQSTVESNDNGVADGTCAVDAGQVSSTEAIALDQIHITIEPCDTTGHI